MDELKHHGIMGQKWGVRRFRNEDGSLTAAGKKRSAQQSGGKSSKSTERERLSRMSDDELRQRINRLNMERQYESLVKDTRVSRGKEAIRQGIKDFALVTGALATVITLRKNAGTIGEWFKKKS